MTTNGNMSNISFRHSMRKTLRYLADSDAVLYNLLAGDGNKLIKPVTTVKMMATGIRLTGIMI